MTYLTRPTVSNEQALQIPDKLARALIHLETSQRTGTSLQRICRYATTTSITLTAVSTTIDTSGTIVEGDRILVKDQGTAENGIYVAGAVVAATCALSRASDCLTADMVQTGMLVSVQEGTAAGGHTYHMSAAGWPGTKVIGTDTMTFAAETTTTYSDATAVAHGLQTAANYNAQVNSNVYQVRGCVDSNVANLAAFVVSQDGITYAAGDIALLCKQTTAAQNGPYVVGTVSGTAPLTRPNWWAAAKVIPEGTIFEAGYGGTLYGGSSWKTSAAKAAVVDTDDPVMYPRFVKGTATLTSGAKALGATEGLWLKSTTKSSIQLTQNTTGGTVTTTVRYICKVANRTAGIIGTAAATINAVTSDGTTVQTGDTSTVDYLITNW